MASLLVGLFTPPYRGSAVESPDRAMSLVLTAALGRPRQLREVDPRDTGSHGCAAATGLDDRTRTLLAL